MDLNCKLSDYEHQARGQVWSKLALYPRSSEGTSSTPPILLLFLDLTIKTSWSCFSSVVTLSWYCSCTEVSRQRPAPAAGCFIHLCLIDDATSNASLVRTWDWVCMKKWTAVSSTSHCWGDCSRPCSLQVRARTSWWGGRHGRTALLLRSLPASLMQTPNIGEFMFFTAEKGIVPSLFTNGSQRTKKLKTCPTTNRLPAADQE